MTDLTMEKARPAVAGENPPTLAELKRRAAALLPELRRGAGDRERNRILPHDQIRRIAAERLLTLRIPVPYGGPGASVREVVQFVADIAAVDSNLAQALRPSFLFLEGLLSSGDEAMRSRWLPRYLRGDVQHGISQP